MRHRISLLLFLASFAACSSGPEAPRGDRKVERLEIEPVSLELIRWQRASLQATAWDADGKKIEIPAIRWTSSDPDLVSVDAKGELLALSPGEAEITAEAGAKRASAKVKVREARLESLTIEPDAPRVVEGRTIALRATVRDEIGQVYTGLPIRWESSAPLYASVDEEGVVTGLTMNRRATITASFQDLRDSVEVEVLAPVLFLDLKPLQVELLEGESAEFRTTLLDANLEPLEPRPIAWSSENEDIVRIDENGVATGVGPGEARIWAEVEEKSSWALVKVEARATQLDLLLEPAEIRVDGQASLRAVARDARGAEVSDLDLRWSVDDPSIASLLGEIRLQGLAPGTTTIRAHDERHGVEASTTLRVREAATFRLSGPPGEVWPAGERFQLVLDVEEENGNKVAPRSPTWFSNDESVAIVDQEGWVELVGVGQATVGVRAEGFVFALDRSVAVRFSEMALGEHSTCGLARNGSVWCWGRKAVVSGGSANYLPSWTPEKVADGVVAIRHGQGACESLPPAQAPVCDVTYGLREDGSLVAFQLGLPPKLVDAPAFSSFDAAGGQLCGITEEGSVHCLGSSEGGFGPVDSIFMHPLGRCLLGGGSLRCEGAGPFDVNLSAWSFAPRNPFPFSASPRHACALTEVGQAICWGENEKGQIQSPASEAGAWLEPVVVAQGIRSLAAAEGVSFLVDEEGRVEVRGMGFQISPAGVPIVEIDDRIPDFSRQGEIRTVYTGPGSHRCALLENDRPYCWGTNEWGEVGSRPQIGICHSFALPIVSPLSPYPEDALRLLYCEGGRLPCVLHEGQGQSCRFGCSC